MMQLERISGTFGVYKLRPDAPLPSAGFCFTARTDDETSLVCRVEDAPPFALAAQEGWACLRVAGQLDFSLVGILSRLTGVLAQAGIP
ncbi:MAG: ACT domain-containing protein, partial [Christensenellaceae bacterium]|nr:ACT domain-containing protein [Christensenellaceae bacterium]